MIDRVINSGIGFAKKHPLLVGILFLLFLLLPPFLTALNEFFKAILDILGKFFPSNILVYVGWVMSKIYDAAANHPWIFGIVLSLLFPLVGFFYSLWRLADWLAKKNADAVAVSSIAGGADGAVNGLNVTNPYE